MDNFSTRANAKTIPIIGLTRAAYSGWVKSQAKACQAWLKSTAYKPDAGSIAFLPGRDGSLIRVVLGLGKPTRDPCNAELWSYAALPGKLPKGRYQLEGDLDPQIAHDAALGWALGCYRYERYLTSKDSNKDLPTLVWPSGVDRQAVIRARNATYLGRDLITTPAADLGPKELAEQASVLAQTHGAEFTVLVGAELVVANYPAIYAVGKGVGEASPRAPRLIDLRWGDADAPKLSLVGKGVVFDSGGLDIKNASGMKYMKKDMGGAASVLALAQMVMDAQLPVRLRVLVPAVENAISAEAFRPLDVLDTRKGITVEVGNTDAEGRLILCDALAEADAEQPDLLIDFATLTGAARTALGTELPALFSTDDDVAAEILAAGVDCVDQLWRMPLFQSYRRHLESRVADINNIANVGTGGAITAALFLKEFVSRKTKWVHIDTMAYNSSSRAGRPAGGEMFGVRAVFEMLRRRYA
jgi:leucyl aminopeptidase